MRQQLESMMDSYQPMVSEQRQATYFVVGDLESLSATALYTGDLPPMGPAGTSFFNVELPESNAQDKGIKISTSKETVIINSYKRIEGKSGIDYFNFLDNSLAGRIKWLNPSEVKYLKDLGKKD